MLGCAVGGINVVGLNPDSQQGDKVILDILKRCGGKFKPIEGGYRFERSLLKATEIDLAGAPTWGRFCLRWAVSATAVPSSAMRGGCG